MSPATFRSDGPPGDGDGDGDRPIAPMPHPPATAAPPGGVPSVSGVPDGSGTGADTPAGGEPAPDPLRASGPDPAGDGPDLGVPPGAGLPEDPTGSAGRRQGLGVGAAALLAMVLTGIPFGLVWSAVAPGVPVVRTDNGTLLAEPQPEEFIAADGWFSLLGFGLGVLVTVAVWLLLRRYRGPLGMLLVVLGMLGAAVLAWQLGRQIGLAGYQRLLETAPVGRTFTKPPDLHGGQFELVAGFIPRIQDLLVPAFAAAVTYTLLAGWSRYPGLRPEPEPEPEPAYGPGTLSWDLPVPPAPSTAPAPPGPDAAEPPRG